jgi:hypothetical protein
LPRGVGTGELTKSTDLDIAWALRDQPRRGCRDDNSCEHCNRRTLWMHANLRRGRDLANAPDERAKFNVESACVVM